MTLAGRGAGERIGRAQEEAPIGTRERAWIIDALRVSDLTPLAAVLASRQIVKVIHNARFERRILAKQGLEIAHVFDTLEASRKNHGRDVLGGHGLAPSWRASPACSSTRPRRPPTGRAGRYRPSRSPTPRPMSKS